mmetsp:Transcript_27223/g.61516  ORF Transcript_27223/g.61516 Transcript_27223/m.61516 type:complete len:92 (+) Transcript_27223:1005-1280(+)
MQESSPPFGRGLASSPFGLGTASLYTPPILPRAEAVQLAEMLVAMLASAQQLDDESLADLNEVWQHLRPSAQRLSPQQRRLLQMEAASICP